MLLKTKQTKQTKRNIYLKKEKEKKTAVVHINPSIIKSLCFPECSMTFSQVKKGEK